MRSVLPLSFLLVLSLNLYSCKDPEENPFWEEGKEFFEVKKIFDDERLPNIITALDGTIVAIWGWNNVRVRRSEDGGQTWGPEIAIAKGLNSGGAIVDEATGDLVIFTEDAHPPAPMHMFRSLDHGKTWKEENIRINPDVKGNVPSLCMNERGISLQRGNYAGRWIRPARYYGEGNGREFWEEHYTTAIYSDDKGKTWHTSAPFPAMGTGEAALEELSDGTIYYNSRRHLSTDGRNPRRRHIARSLDGGETWVDLSVSEELPDGDQHRDYGLMAGLSRLPVKDHDILLFSNINSPEGRTNGTVWVSFDGGLTWPVKKLVEAGGFAYSSMVAGRNGTASEGKIYLFYEGGGHPETTGNMAIFNLTWLLDGRDWKDFLPD